MCLKLNTHACELFPLVKLVCPSCINVSYTVNSLCLRIVGELMRKRAHTHFVREHTATVVSARLATVDWSLPKEGNECARASLLKKKKKAQAGKEWSNLLPKPWQAKKKPPSDLSPPYPPPPPLEQLASSSCVNVSKTVNTCACELPPPLLWGWSVRHVEML